MRDDVLYDGQVHGVVAVHEDVAEAGHVAELHRQRRVDPAAAGQQGEQLAVGARLAEALVGHDVGGGVQGGLDRELEGVLDEALLAHVHADGIGTGQLPELPDAGVDDGEPLGDEVRIGHSAGVPIRRYSRRIG